MGDTRKDSTLAFVATSKTPDIKFVASLSDGRTVIQDDRKNERHAWVRLADWLKINTDISISNIRLQGPKGIDIKMPSNQKGYFFGKRQQAVWGSSQQNCIGIGYYDGRKVNIVWYLQPKFDSSFTEERDVAKSGFFLIRNP